MRMASPAGPRERSISRHALARNRRCRNFFLSAVYTSELQKRIQGDRLVDKYYDIIEILEDPDIRDHFLDELFHFSLRLI